MVVALGANPAQLNLGITTSVSDALPSQAIIEGLIRLDAKLEPAPVLAESWEVGEDGKTVKFNLRKGVQWHDGKPFSAKDVVYSLQNITRLHARAAPIFSNVESVTSPDDMTVVVSLKEPFAPFLSFLTSDNVAILPHHLYEGTDPTTNPVNFAPVGTGPFKFESWESGQSITLVKNENYWEEGRPYLDKLIFSIIPDANSRMLALEAGDIDMVTNFFISISDIERMKQAPGITVYQAGGIPRPLLLVFNSKTPALGSAAVRKALFRGLDREMIIDSAYAGEGQLGRSAVPPGIAWAYNPDIDYMKMYAFDPAAANAELDAAGFPRDANGRRFSVRFSYDTSQSGFAEVGEVMRANWADLGVDVNLEGRERNVVIDSVFQRKDFDTFVSFYLAGIDPAFGVDRAYRCEDIRPAAFTNASQYCNEQLDSLLNEARVTTDRGERARLYREAQKIIAEDLPTAVLLDSPHGQAVSSRFGNLESLFEVANDVTLRFSEVYMNK